MKWFEHESASHNSPKMLRLITKHGMRGFGLYWYIIELIAENWEKYECSIHPEYDFELISGLVRDDSGDIPDTIRWMADNGLFEQDSDGGLTCPSLNDHLGETAKKMLRKKIKDTSPKLKAGCNPEQVRIDSGTSPDGVRDKGKERKGEEIKGKKSIHKEFIGNLPQTTPAMNENSPHFYAACQHYQKPNVKSLFWARNEVQEKTVEIIDQWHKAGLMEIKSGYLDKAKCQVLSVDLVENAEDIIRSCAASDFCREQWSFRMAFNPANTEDLLMGKFANPSAEDKLKTDSARIAKGMKEIEERKLA